MSTRYTASIWYAYVLPKSFSDDIEGYGKYEAVGSLTVGTLLLFCGAGVAIDSFQALWVEPSVSGSIAGLQRETQLALAASMAGVSITAKELLYRATVRVGKRIRSKVNAPHVDKRSQKP